MGNSRDIIGIDAKRTCSGQNGSYRTIIDREPSAISCRQTSGVVIRLRKAKLAVAGRKAKLAAVAVALLFVGVLAAVNAPGLIPQKLPAEALADPGWGAAELIETDDSGDAGVVRLAMDSSGNAMAVWRQSDGTVDHILSNRYVVGEGWKAVELVETNDSVDASSPDVGVDASGNAIAIWLQPASGKLHLWSNRYVVGEGWGIAELIEFNETEPVYAIPHVAVSSSGNAFAVWFQEGAKFLDVWSNHYVVGDGWKGPALIETYESGNAYNPRVAMDSSGNAFAVWDQVNGTHTGIASNRYEVGVGWGEAEYIETDDSAYAIDAEVEMDSEGNAIAVWIQAVPPFPRYDCWSNRYVVGEGWGKTAEMIETDMSSNVIWHDLAVDNSGNAFAVWSENVGDYSNISSNRYVVGEGWKTAETICAFNIGEDVGYSWPEVAVDGLGNAIAVWDMYDVTLLSHIWSSRYDVGTGWGTAGLIETYDSADSYEPQVAVDGSGNAVAVWYQYDVTWSSIYSNRYVSLIPEFSITIVPLMGIAVVFLVTFIKHKKRD